MFIGNEYAVPTALNAAAEENGGSITDWNSLNRLIKIVENFRPFGNQAEGAEEEPKAAFRITMKDNMPVFDSGNGCKCPQNNIAGLTGPDVYTANNAGNRTAPYTFIKSPVPEASQAGGAIFIPPGTRRRGPSFVDVISWNNTLPQAPGQTPVVVHPEQQFMHWLNQQKAKDPNFINRIGKINMRFAHMPCKTCSHSIANKLVKMVGTGPKINIRVNSNNASSAAAPAMQVLNRPASITATHVPAGIPNPALRSQVMQAIAQRAIKQGINPAQAGMAQPRHNKAPLTRIANPAMQARVQQDIAQRTLKQGTRIAQPNMVRPTKAPLAGIPNPTVQNRVQQAIAQRAIKQAQASPVATSGKIAGNTLPATANPVVKNNIKQAIAARTIKQAAAQAATGGQVKTAPIPGITNPAIKNKVANAIAERQAKQSAPQPTPIPATPKPASVQAAQNRINNLKQQQKEMAY